MNQHYDFFVPRREKHKLQLPIIADNVSNQKDKIVINGDGNPQMLYLSHRKGWICNDIQLSDPQYFNKIKQKGCKYIFINKYSFKQELCYKKGNGKS